MNDGVNMEWVRDVMEIEGIKCDYWYRNPLECIKFIIGHPPFKDHLRYAPEKVYGKEGCIYNKMWTGDWWWREQVNITPAVEIGDKTSRSRWASRSR